MKMKVTILGVDRLAAKLRKISNDASKEVADRLLEAAFEIESRAKDLAPVDTGRLRASITTTRIEGGAKVYTDVVYGPFVEFGTSRTPAQPYMQPAIAAVKLKLSPILRKHVSEVIT